MTTVVAGRRRPGDVAGQEVEKRPIGRSGGLNWPPPRGSIARTVTPEQLSINRVNCMILQCGVCWHTWTYFGPVTPHTRSLYLGSCLTRSHGGMSTRTPTEPGTWGTPGRGDAVTGHGPSFPPRGPRSRRGPTRLGSFAGGVIPSRSEPFARFEAQAAGGPRASRSLRGAPGPPTSRCSVAPVGTPRSSRRTVGSADDRPPTWPDIPRDGVGSNVTTDEFAVPHPSPRQGHACCSGLDPSNARLDPAESIPTDVRPTGWAARCRWPGGTRVRATAPSR